MLKILNLSVSRGGKDVLRGVSLEVGSGELVALLGPNGVGKSTLAMTLFGHPSCLITAGSMSLSDVDLAPLKTHERAKLGLFLAHQEPPMIAGVTVAEVLRAVSDATRPQAFSTAEFFDKLRASLARLGLSQEFADRDLHVAFSGGEKKRSELLALLMLTPKFAVLDEVDSGMDAVARALTKDILAELRSAGTGLLIISHNEGFIDELSPTRRVFLG